jgi:hypothetical protein
MCLAAYFRVTDNRRPSCFDQIPVLFALVRAFPLAEEYPSAVTVSPKVFLYNPPAPFIGMTPVEPFDFME